LTDIEASVSPGVAASPGAEASPMAEPPGPIGVDSQHVCLEIHGPVTLLTAESLTQGIMDGTFTIVGLSTQCDVGAGASPAASPLTGVTASPAASPMTGTAEGSPGASPAP
jgi:hypothetical protein